MNEASIFLDGEFATISATYAGAKPRVRAAFGGLEGYCIVVVTGGTGTVQDGHWWLGGREANKVTNSTLAGEHVTLGIPKRQQASAVGPCRRAARTGSVGCPGSSPLRGVDSAAAMADVESKGSFGNVGRAGGAKAADTAADKVGDLSLIHI